MSDTLLFALLSISLVIVSRRSILKPHVHGFYRFFAWESMLALFTMNYRLWFHDPFSPAQVGSWLLLILSLYLLIAGVVQLASAGRSKTRQDHDTNLGFENTGGLITTGIYHYIRHPLYTSLLALTWGIFLKEISPGGAALAGLSSILIYLTAKVEEAEKIKTFGQPYTAYMKHNKMLIPSIL
jgi:protein-S-isoprenylcysteine O-methyltransferase Ste14